MGSTAANRQLSDKKNIQTFAGNAFKWIGKRGANGSPEWHFHSVGMASLDLHLCPVWVSSAHLAKCILCQNVQLAVKVTAFNFQPSALTP